MYEERKIVIIMNPKQLRDLADKMEEKFPKLVPGNTTFIDFLGYSQDLKVCLHLDQKSTAALLFALQEGLLLGCREKIVIYTDSERL